MERETVGYTYQGETFCKNHPPDAHGRSFADIGVLYAEGIDWQFSTCADCYEMLSIAAGKRPSMADAVAYCKVSLAADEQAVGAHGGSKWLCVLTMEGRTFETPFTMGRKSNEPPSAADVVACCVMDASGVRQDGVFNDDEFVVWCGEFGVNPDSREAEHTYRAVLSQTQRFIPFAGDKLSLFTQCEW